MNRLIAPTDKALETMDKFGLNFKDNNGNFKDFAGIIGELNRGLGDLSSSDKTKAINQIFGQIPMAGILSLMTAGEDEIRKLTETLETCDGAAQEMADIKMDTLMGQWMRFRAEVSNTAAEFGKSLSPFAKDLLSYLNDRMPSIREKLVGFGDWLSENEPKIVDIAKTIGKVGVAFAGLSLGNKVFNGIGDIIESVYKLSSLGGLVSTLNPVNVAIAGIAGSIAYLSATSETFRGDLGSSFENLASSINNLKDAFKGLDIDLDGTLSKFGKFSLNGIGAGVIGFINTLSAGISTVSSLLDGLGKQFGSLGTMLGGYKEFFSGNFIEGITQISNGFGDFLNSGIDNLKSTLSFGNKSLENTFINPYKNAYNNTYTANGESSFQENSEQTVSINYEVSGGEEAALQAQTTAAAIEAIPDNKDTILNINGGEEAVQQTESAAVSIQSIPDNKDTTLNISGGEEAVQQAQTTAAAVEAMPSQKNVDINVNSNNMDSMVQTASSVIDAIPTIKNTIINVAGAEEATSKATSVGTAVTAIPSSHNTSITVTGAEAAIGAASSVAAAISAIPSSKTVTVSVQQVGSADVQQNAMGTSFFSGGATTVAENGYEVVSFGKGAQIFSHGDSKELLNDYYKNQAALAKEDSKNRNYQVSKGSNDGKVINLSFNISGGNTNDIVNKVAMQLTQVLENQA